MPSYIGQLSEGAIFQFTEGKNPFPEDGEYFRVVLRDSEACDPMDRQRIIACTKDGSLIVGAKMSRVDPHRECRVIDRDQT